ncbi:hypothetical protein O6H91_05G121700 [Diphasiastrum complanatum]|uniref:Uncharacterized protein n=1 Tax=Diphasiastrum complanatum TaxID=34168 RepID=A0ACC2DT90_DIPCM|nr:hypothetical protein O6H91_05G121700 [Diphasiastrum complanatum]
MMRLCKLLPLGIHRFHSAASKKQTSSVGTSSNEEASVGVLRRQLLGTKKRAGGMCIELIHKDNLTPSNVDEYTRIQQAVQRSNLRARRLGSMAWAFSMSKDSRRLIDFTTLLSLSSEEAGVYLMQLQLGMPVTSFHAGAYTGIDLVWVQCQPCQSCYQTKEPIFDPSSCSSYS